MAFSVSKGVFENLDRFNPFKKEEIDEADFTAFKKADLEETDRIFDRFRNHKKKYKSNDFQAHALGLIGITTGILSAIITIPTLSSFGLALATSAFLATPLFAIIATTFLAIEVIKLIDRQKFAKKMDEDFKDYVKVREKYDDKETVKDLKKSFNNARWCRRIGAVADITGFALGATYFVSSTLFSSEMSAILAPLSLALGLPPGTLEIALGVILIFTELAVLKIKSSCDKNMNNIIDEHEEDFDQWINNNKEDIKNNEIRIRFNRLKEELTEEQVSFLRQETSSEKMPHDTGIEETNPQHVRQRVMQERLNKQDPKIAAESREQKQVHLQTKTRNMTF